MLCNICNKEAVLIQEKFVCYIDGKTSEIYSCTNCDAQFAPEQHTSEIYDTIYHLGKLVPGYDRYWKYAEQIKQKKKPLAYLKKQEEAYYAINKIIEKIAPNPIKKTIRILEVGSGLGYTTYALNKAGFDTIGLDISKIVVDNATKKFGNFYVCGDIKEYAEQHRDVFDIVIATEVIEHIIDISSFMNALKTCLTPKGKIIITTPNKSAFPKGSIWKTELPPVHYWWLSEKSLKNLAIQFNMNVSFFSFKNFYLFNPNFITDGNITPTLSFDYQLIKKSTIFTPKLKNYIHNKLNKILVGRYIVFIYFFIKKTIQRKSFWLLGKKGIGGGMGYIICAIFDKNNRI